MTSRVLLVVWATIAGCADERGDSSYSATGESGGWFLRLDGREVVFVDASVADGTPVPLAQLPTGGHGFHVAPFSRTLRLPGQLLVNASLVDGAGVGVYQDRRGILIGAENMNLQPDRLASWNFALMGGCRGASTLPYEPGVYTVTMETTDSGGTIETISLSVRPSCDVSSDPSACRLDCPGF